MSDDLVHVDPVKLHQFADELAETLEYYRKAIDTLNNRLSALGRSWQDRQFEEFRNEVRTTQKIMAEFIQEGSVARRNLLDDAARAEQYQKINLN